VGNTTAHLHFDANENLFLQLVGTRTWTLFPPKQSGFLYESYMLETTEAGLDGESSDIDLSYFTSPVDWQNHDYARFPLLRKAQPVRVVLQPGEVLYVPSYWWHQVEAAPATEVPGTHDVTVGINKWFDPVFDKVAPCAACKLQPNRKAYPAMVFGNTAT
jgi:jumonji domain-containing protein 7